MYTLVSPFIILPMEVRTSIDGGDRQNVMSAVCPYKYIHCLCRNILGKGSWQGHALGRLYCILVKKERSVWFPVEYELPKGGHFNNFSFGHFIVFIGIEILNGA